MTEHKFTTKRIVLLSILIGLSIIGFYLWIVFVSPYLLRIPKDFSYSADLVSVDNLFDETTGHYSGEKYSNSSFSYKILSHSGNKAKIQNNFEVRSFDGKKNIFIKSDL